jgi:hypothetical protein
MSDSQQEGPSDAVGITFFSLASSGTARIGLRDLLDAQEQDVLSGLPDSSFIW